MSTITTKNGAEASDENLGQGLPSRTASKHELLPRPSSTPRWKE